MLSAAEDSDKDISEMSKAELIEAAEEIGIEEAESKTKAQLRAAILKARGNLNG